MRKKNRAYRLFETVSLFQVARARQRETEEAEMDPADDVAGLKCVRTGLSRLLFNVIYSKKIQLDKRSNSALIIHNWRFSSGSPICVQ